LVEAPFIINGPALIAEGAVLTMEPGVEVRFAMATGLVVAGRMIAQGTIQRPIVFHSHQAAPQWGDWEQIYVLNTGSVFKYIDVRDSKFGVYQSGVSNNVTYSHFENNVFASLFANGSSPQVTNNVVTNNQHGFFVLGGITAEGIEVISRPVMNNNQFSNQLGFHVYTVSTTGHDLRSTILNAENNDWGTTVGSEIMGKIQDGNDDPFNSPILDFEPFL
jgi:hypothetical protein